MKCPLKREVIKDNFGNSYDNSPDCIKEECAWWYKDNGVCAVLTLAQGLVYQHKVLLNMESKMPHAG